MTDAANATPETVPAITRFWAEIPADDVVTAALYRVGKSKADEKYLGLIYLTRESYPTEYHFYEEVKAKRGGGKYELRVTTDSGQWVARPSFCIGGAPKDDDGDDKPAAAGGFEKLAALLIEQNRASEERTAALLRELKAQPQLDPFVMFDRAAALLQRSGAVERPRGLVEQLAELKQAREVIASLVDGGADEKSVMDTVMAQFGPQIMTMLPQLLAGMGQAGASGGTATTAIQPGP